jgi:hypothetical protein
VGTLAPASSGLKDPVPGALSPHATQCLCQNRLPDRGERKPTSTDCLWSPISPLLECPYLRHEKRRYRARVGWGCLLVIFRGGKIRGLIRSGSQDRRSVPLEKGGVAFALFPLPGHFSVGSGRFPRACCGIRAVKGSVRAPGVSVRVVVGVPVALSRIFSESRGVLRARLRDHGPQGSAFSRLCVPLMSRYGAYLPGSYRRHPRFYFSFVLWCSAVCSPRLHG